MASQSVVLLQTPLPPYKVVSPHHISATGQGRDDRDAEGSLPAARAQERTASNTKTMAIVDDEQDLVDIYKIMAGQFGYVVEFTASDGAETVRAFQEEKIRPAVILLDYRMRTMNGIEAAEKIRQVDNAVKIVIVTADDSVKERATSEGFGYLQKPFTMSQLRDILETL